MSYNRGSENQDFFSHISRFLGETVTVFTESGGASGCGFTGILISVNCNFIKLVNRQGTAPSSPLIGPDCMEDGKGCGSMGSMGYPELRGLGSECDIPIRQIVAFCHNAV